MSQQYLSIKEAASEFELSEAWVRRMVHKDLVSYKRVQVGNTKVRRIEIERSSIEARVTGGRSRRDDGRGKYTLYATPEELEQIQAALEAAGIETPLQRANPRKGESTPVQLNPVIAAE
jgi:hypothetical protein